MTEWISTGDAARMLGYSTRHFVRKFITIFHWRRSETGNYRWDRAEIELYVVGVRPDK